MRQADGIAQTDPVKLTMDCARATGLLRGVSCRHGVLLLPGHPVLSGRARARCEPIAETVRGRSNKPGAGFPGNTREADGRRAGFVPFGEGIHRAQRQLTAATVTLSKVIGGMGGESEAIQIRSTERGRWNEAERAPAAHYDMSDGWGGRKGDYGFICLVKRHRSTTTATSHVTSLAGFVACLINLVII